MMKDEEIWESELEVVFSLMSDGELNAMNTKLEMLIEETAFQVDKFPLSLGGIRWVQSVVMFSYWMRRGKGVRIEGGEVVVCELGESPFVEKYRDKITGDVTKVEVGNGGVKGRDEEDGGEGDGEWV